MAKMDSELVRFMRDDYAQGSSLRELASSYGMSLKATYAIVTNFTWVDKNYVPVMRKRGRVPQEALTNENR
jgi:Mor family transcriptional regulator